MQNEQELIAKITKGFQRSPLQLNQCHESDAELIQLFPGAPIIAITTDSLVEEITSGLYDDYYLIGWMIVMANVSDLSAVGATPTGILISQGLPELPEGDLSALQKGILDATIASKTPLLGGDVNTSPFLSLTGTALGSIQNGLPMTRMGCKPNDIVALTGKAGSGNLFAYEKLFTDKVTTPYLPKAKIREGQLLKNFASSCMDTSDGVFHSMNELGRLNNVGFTLNSPLADIVVDQIALPHWMLLAGIHGEFELLCTIPQEKWLNAQKTLPLIEVGKVIASPGIYFENHYFSQGIFHECWNRSKTPAEYLKNLEALCKKSI